MRFFYFIFLLVRVRHIKGYLGNIYDMRFFCFFFSFIDLSLLLLNARRYCGESNMVFVSSLVGVLLLKCIG